MVFKNSILDIQIPRGILCTLIVQNYHLNLINYKMNKLGIVLFIAALLLCIQGQEPPPIIVPNCTAVFNTTDVCMISNINFTLGGISGTPVNFLDISHTGNITFTNVYIGCQDQCLLDPLNPASQVNRADHPYDCCRVRVTSGGDITLANDQTNPNITFTNFKVSVVELFANNSIQIQYQNQINTTGLGLAKGQGYDSNNPVGGSYSAQAGTLPSGISASIAKTYGNFYQTPEMLTDMNTDGMGSGGGTIQNAGGGRVVMRARVFKIQGKVLANGIPRSTQSAVGGSGGYIYLNQTIDPLQLDDSVITDSISADGGTSQQSGGSGGRIILEFNTNQLNSTKHQSFVFAQGGGQNSPGTNFQTVGGTGTIYWKNEAKLYLKQLDQLSSTLTGPVSVIQQCPQYNPGDYIQCNLQNLVLDTNARATFELINQTTKDIIVNLASLTMEVGSNLVPNPITNDTKVFTLNVKNRLQVRGGTINTFNFQGSGTQAINQTTINAQLVIINSTSSVSKIWSGPYLDIKATESVNIVGAGQVYANSFDPSNPPTVESIRDIYNRDKSYMSIIAEYPITNQGTLQADYIFLYSKSNIIITGQIQPQTALFTCTYNENGEVFSFIQTPSQLPLDEATLKRNYATQFNLLTPDQLTISQIRDGLRKNFTVTIIAMNQLYIQTGAKIQTSRFGSYSNNIIIKGTIDTSSRGCLAGDGIARGRHKTSRCSGTGGANGGNGGSGSSFTQDAATKYECESFRAQSYGRYDSFQVLEGSGGGFQFTGQQDFSSLESLPSGGGYIWIESNIVNVSSGAQLLANGGKDVQSINNGGGAGGSIFIGLQSINISKQDSESNLVYIQANGADAQSNGGAGGGGRVKFYYFSWFNRAMYQMNYNHNEKDLIIVEANGGKGIKDKNLLTTIQPGEDGSIWSPPCAPGFEKFDCRICQAGYYKTEFSNIDCKPCENMPPDIDNRATYKSPLDPSNKTILFLPVFPMCPYKCSVDDSEMKTNPKCLSQLDLFFDNLGGLPVFIILALATVFSIIVVGYVFYKKKKGGDTDNFENDENLYRLKLAVEELDFIQRDLYQHISRVYLVGNNELQSPWVLPVYPPYQIRNRVDLSKYQEFAKKINGCYVPGRCEKFWTIILPFLFPPLKPLYNKFKRLARFYAFKKVFISVADKLDFWRSFEDQINIELRFTASDDYTQGFLDFLDTKRSKDSFDRPQMPMTIIVAGTGEFSKPFHINRHDPLIRSVSLYLEDNILWDMFLANLNTQLLTICLENFGFLVRWRLQKTAKYIQDMSRKLFEKKGLRLQLWLLEAKSLNKCKGLTVAGEDANFIEKLNQNEEYYVLTQDYMRKKKDIFNRLVDYWRTETFYNSQKIFKLALVITQANDTQPGQYSMRSPKIRDRDNDSLKADTDGSSSPRRRIPANSGSPSSRLQNRFSDNPNNVNPSNGQPTIENYIQLLIGSIRQIHIDYTRVKNFKNYNYGVFTHLENAANDNSSKEDNFAEYKVSCGQKVKHIFKTLLMIPNAFIKSVSLRHSRVVKKFIIAATLYMFFVVIDIAFTIALIVYSFNAQGVNSTYRQLLFLFCFYPLASILSPMLALLSVMMCKAFVYRVTAYLNALSLYTNLLAFLISDLVISSITENQSIVSQRVGYTVILMFTKVMLSQLLSLQVAYFRNTEYWTYNDKLDEMIRACDREEQARRSRNVQMDMILENTQEQEESSPQGRMRRIPLGGLGAAAAMTNTGNNSHSTVGALGGSTSNKLVNLSSSAARYDNVPGMPQRTFGESIGGAQNNFRPVLFAQPSTAVANGQFHESEEEDN